MLSFISLFFNKINNPKPLFDNRALIATPNEIFPFINIIVTAIDTAQFGIKPTNAEIIQRRYVWIFLKKLSSDRYSKR